MQDQRESSKMNAEYVNLHELSGYLFYKRSGAAGIVNDNSRVCVR